MHRPMRAALRPISPRSRNGASAGSRPARLPNVTAALPPSQPARRTKPQQLLFRLHRRPQRRSGQTVCGGGGAFVPRREATPKLRPPAHSLRSSPLPSSPLWHLASPHLWPVGRTDGGGRPLCLQTRSCNDVSDVAKNWFRCQVSLAYISLSPRFCQTRTLADAFSRKRPSVGHCLRKLRSNKRRARRPTLARPHLCESS